MGIACHDGDGSSRKNVRAGSQEEFITEHYWGYTAGKRTSEYRVEHPRWRIWPAQSARLEADLAVTLRGAVRRPRFPRSPASAFIAEGSHVQVWRRIDDPVLVEAVAAEKR